MRKRIGINWSWMGIALGSVCLALGARAQNTTTFGNIVSQGVPCGAANCVYYQLPPATPWVVVTVAGTWTGTLETAVTAAPNANYANLSTIAWTALGTSAANGTWSVSTSGQTYLRVRATSWTIGAANVTMAAAQAQLPLPNPVLQGTMTASGLEAPAGGSSANCWTTDGGDQPCSGAAASININGALVPSANLNGSSPAPDAGYTAGVWKVSGSNAIVEVPNGAGGVTSLNGETGAVAVQGDSTITVTPSGQNINLHATAATGLLYPPSPSTALSSAAYYGAVSSSGVAWIGLSSVDQIAQVTKTGAVSVLTVTGALFGQNSQGVFDPSGNFWINAGTTIYKLSPSGTVLSSFPVANTTYGMTLDQAGNVWVSYYNTTPDVAVYSSTGTLLHTITAGYAQNLFTDASGVVWATDYLSGLVYRMSASTFAVLTTTNVGLGGTLHLAFDSTGNAWVSGVDAAISEVAANGSGVLITYNLPPYFFSGGNGGERFYGIAVDGNNNIWVTGTPANGVQSYVTVLNEAGYDLGTFFLGSNLTGGTGITYGSGYVWAGTGASYTVSVFNDAIATPSASSAGSTFNASGDIVLPSIATATSTNNYNSYLFRLVSSYFNVIPLADQWYASNVLGAGTAPTSTLVFSHTGTPGTLGFAIPPIAPASGGPDCLQISTTGQITNTGAACGGGSGSGTVTSVGLSTPSWLTVSGSPVTTSGTLAVTGTSETANYFLAAPNGSAGAMLPRAIVAADIPTLNQSTTGTAANVTATSNGTLTTLSSLALPYSQLSGVVPTWNQNTTGTAVNLTGCTPSTAGDLCYYTGTSWARVAGNSSGTNYLQETSAGVPSWTAPAGSGTVSSVSITSANGVSGTVATATTTPAISLTLGAITPTSLVATGIVDGQAPITITTGTTANLGATYNSGYTFNQEATAGTGVTYTLPATATGQQYCVANSGTTGVVNTGVLTVYPPSSSYIIYKGVVNTVGGGGTHGIASGGAAGDSACFIAIDATHWLVLSGSGVWTEN